MNEEITKFVEDFQMWGICPCCREWKAGFALWRFENCPHSVCDTCYPRLAKLTRDGRGTPLRVCYKCPQGCSISSNVSRNEMAEKLTVVCFNIKKMTEAEKKTVDSYSTFLEYYQNHPTEGGKCFCKGWNIGSIWKFDGCQHSICDVCYGSQADFRSSRHMAGTKLEFLSRCPHGCGFSDVSRNHMAEELVDFVVRFKTLVLDNGDSKKRSAENQLENGVTTKQKMIK